MRLTAWRCRGRVTPPVLFANAVETEQKPIFVVIVISMLLCLWLTCSAAVAQWSLGVILYQLFVGRTPFFSNSLYSLVNLIVKVR